MTGMFRLSRRQLSLSLLAVLAACGAQPPRPQFKTYSGPPVTQIVVYKGQRRMHLLSGRTVLKSYDFGLGNQPVGHKQFDGDGKTPEGLYFVDRFNPRSRYHLSVGISYPNEHDRAYAAQFGRHPGATSCFMAVDRKATSWRRGTATGRQDASPSPMRKSRISMRC